MKPRATRRLASRAIPTYRRWVAEFLRFHHSSPSLPHKPRLSLIACMERGPTLLLIPDKNPPVALTRQWSSLTLRVSVTRPSFRQGEVAHAGDRRRSSEPNRKA